MISENLQSTIDEGVELISAHPKGELPKRFRIKLWSLIGPRLKNESIVPDQGSASVIRYRLARSCLSKVLPIWENAFPHDTTPYQLRDVADSVLFDKSRVQLVRSKYDEGWLYADNFAAQLWDANRDIQYTASVCYCACRLIDVALADEKFNESNLDDQTWLDFDPYTEDPAFYASGVYSKGFQSKPLTGEFWGWYLQSALPSAIWSNG